MKLACTIVLVLVSAAPLRAQSPTPARDDQPVNSWCRDAHPTPTCHSYLIFEITGSKRLSGTSSARCVPSSLPGCTRRDLPDFLAWDLGWMVNASVRRSVGASIQIGGSDEGARVAIRARHRLWLDHGVVVDAAVGPLLAQQQTETMSGLEPTYGFTGDAGVGVARIGTLSIGGDAARRTGRMTSALRVGLRLESRGAAFASAISAVGGILTLIALGKGF